MAFRDKYTDFTFDDKKSASYKVWITNKNDLQLALTPNFKDKFTSPQFGGVRYLDGTTIEKTDIKISCIAIDVTLNEWRAICNWLSPTKTGKLSFAFNNDSYYNVKLSSKVDAKMFNYGGKDSLLGGRKIIEFSLSFTTVGDYAAMGPINTGQIDCERSEGTTFTDVMNELVNRSMNHYRVPCIISDTTQIAPEDNITGLDLLLDKDKSNLFKWYSADGSTHQMEYNTTTNKWNYVVSNTATEDIYYSANHEESYISVLQQKSTMDVMTGTVQKLDTDRTGFNIFNTGEYESYPRIMLNKVSNSFEVWLDDTLYYKYEIRDGRELNNIVIDCQSGTVTYNGRFIENATDAFGYALINSSYNFGPLCIPSGHPEIHKGKLITATNSNLTFTLAEPLMENYNDNINVGVTITRNIKNTTKYGEGLYDNGYYEPHMVGNNQVSLGLTDSSFYFTDVHDYIEQIDSTDLRKIKIHTTPSKLSASWSSTNSIWSDYSLSTSLDKDQIFYVSFCEGHRLTIKVNGEVPTQSFISMQSRGAI